MPAAVLALHYQNEVLHAAGRIVLNGANLRGASPEQIVHRGVALVPEGRHVFASMTVQEVHQ